MFKTPSCPTLHLVITFPYCRHQLFYQLKNFFKSVGKLKFFHLEKCTATPLPPAPFDSLVGNYERCAKWGCQNEEFPYWNCFAAPGINKTYQERERNIDGDRQRERESEVELLISHFHFLLRFAFTSNDF